MRRCNLDRRVSWAGSVVLTLVMALAGVGGTAVSPEWALAKDATSSVNQTAASADSEKLWAASFKDITGTLQPLSQYQGKVAVVYFWATWCEACQKEGPALQALYDKYKGKDLVVIGVAVDNADKVKEFVKKNVLSFPVVYGGREAVQLSKDLGNSVGGIPFLVVVGQDGKIVERIIGETKDGRIEGLVAPLLAG